MWSSPREEGAKGVQGNFIQLEIHLGRGPSPLVLPLAREVIIKASGVPKLASLRHCIQFFPVVLADLIMAGELL